MRNNIFFEFAIEALDVERLNMVRKQKSNTTLHIFLLIRDVGNRKGINRYFGFEGNYIYDKAENNDQALSRSCRTTNLGARATKTNYHR